jgi:hypothetical protein
MSAGAITMPMHDWTRVNPGTYHNFHYRWLASIMDQLNGGVLPAGYVAMAEQIIGRPEGDVVALEFTNTNQPNLDSGSVALAPPPRPQTSIVMPLETERYARKAHRIAVHHPLGNVVAVVELVSPGNKDTKHALRSFVEKSVDLLLKGIHLLIIDPFPPGRHDPGGLHQAIWNELTDADYSPPPGKPLTIAAYQAAPTKTAFIEPLAVGDALPVMPLFLYDDYYVSLPLEETYQATWNVLPAVLQGLVEK